MGFLPSRRIRVILAGRIRIVEDLLVRGWFRRYSVALSRSEPAYRMTQGKDGSMLRRSD